MVVVVPGQSADPGEALWEVLGPIAVRRLEVAGHSTGLARTVVGSHRGGGSQTAGLALTDRGYLSMQLKLAHQAMRAGGGQSPVKLNRIGPPPLAYVDQLRGQIATLANRTEHTWTVLGRDLNAFGVDVHLAALQRLSRQIAGRGAGCDVAAQAQREILHDVYAGELDRLGFSVRTAEAAAGQYLANRLPIDPTPDPTYYKDLTALLALADRMQPRSDRGLVADWRSVQTHAAATSQAGIRAGLLTVPPVTVADVIELADDVDQNPGWPAAAELSETLAVHRGAFCYQAEAQNLTASAPPRPAAAGRFGPARADHNR